MSSIYKITLLKFFEKLDTNTSYKKTMIPHNILIDGGVNALPLSHKWLLINLLLIAGDFNNETVTMTERQVNEALTTKEGSQNALTLLQSFQILTFEKIPLSLKERKKEGRNRKRARVGTEVPTPNSINVLKFTKNEVDSSPTMPEVAKESGAEKLLRIWNENRNSLPSALHLSNGQRKKSASARWSEFPDEEFWKNVVRRISESEFCLGKNDRGWKADFDFLVKPDTHVKVNEGKYDSKSRNAQRSMGVQGS